MKASFHLWRQWSAQVHQLLPEVHRHRSKTLAFFVFGLVLSGKARLPVIAEDLLCISSAKTPSIERRLARFLANQQVVVAPIWTSLLAHLLRFFQNRRLVFVLDLTPLDERACVVYLGLLVHSRLLPVGWQVMPLQETWEERQWAIVGILLERVLPHLGQAECTLIADRGLAGLPVVQLCQARGWHSSARASPASIPVCLRAASCLEAGTRVLSWSAGGASPGSVQPWSGRTTPWQRFSARCGTPASASPGGPALRSAGRTPPRAGVSSAQAGGVLVPRFQTPRLGHRGNGDSGPRSTGSLAPGPVLGRLVGQPTGLVLHAGRPARPL